MLGRPRLGKEPFRQGVGLLLMAAGGIVLMVFLPGWIWVLIAGLGLLGGGIYLLLQ